MAIVVYRNGRPIFSRASGQYNGDKTGGEFRRWNVFDTDPNAFLLNTYGELAKRNATLYNTSSIARACVNKPISYSIGDGLFFRSAINADFLGLSAKKAKDWSRKFTELLHLEKMAAGYYDIQPLLAREAKITGDSLLYFLRDLMRDLPIEFIPEGGHGIAWDQSRDNTVLGIQVDDWGRAIGFIRDKKGYPVLKFVDDNNNINAIQFMFKERAGQLRGYGCFYSEIARAKGLDRVWDATIERMGLEATQLGWFEVDTSDPTAQAERMAQHSLGTTTETTLSQVPGSQDMAPGGMYVFRNNEKMQFSDLKTPSNNFGMANEWALKMFSMATGYAPEFILGEYSTSYTAHKGALNDVWKRIMWERNTQIRNVDDKVNLEYLKYFVSRGEINVKPSFFTDHRIRQAYLAGSYLGPVPGQVNPLQEIKAYLEANNAGIIDKSYIASTYGIDFWNNIDEWSAQQQAWFDADPTQVAAVMAESDNQPLEDDNSQPVTENQEDDNG